jgi:anti-sigma regulatory factor (Ser/Thr protein kinase)
MSVTLRLSLPADAQAPRAARAALRGLHCLDDGVRATATLLLSELVTNAVRHAGLRADEEIDVTIAVGDGVRVAVADGGPGFVHDLAARAGRPDGGRGLFLVDLLATRWGVDRGACARVWFELDGVG